MRGSLVKLTRPSPTLETMLRRQILTVPNALSALRLACAPLFVWLIFAADERVAAFVLLGVLGSTDWVDGWIARRFHQGSELGKILDPTADRVLLLTAAVALLIDGTVPAWVAGAVLAREVLVAGATLALAAAGARRIEVQWAGKAGTLALMFALPGFLLVDLLGAGATQDVVRALTWFCAAAGLALSYYAAAMYVPFARAALREGRDARAATTERIPA
jgi:cardiolipin synthase